MSKISTRLREYAQLSLLHTIILILWSAKLDRREKF